MISPELIVETVKDHVRYGRGKFHFSDDEFQADKYIEIPPYDILLPFIGMVDEHWPFDIEPDPRNVGMLIELLRGCRFFSQSEKIEKLAIVSDVKTSRNLGAYDTPEPIVRYITEEVIESFLKSNKSENPPLILDPACGAGYFLIAAVDGIKSQFPDNEITAIVSKSIIGFDIDPVAVSLSKRNLIYHLKEKYGIDSGKDILDKIILNQDALADFQDLPNKKYSVDCVIGNPPYQFYSGKGSPVKALERAGKLSESNKLAVELNILSKRFPQSSIGCLDRYKWFINRAIELIKPDGVLGFITPNTWLQYPRYRDIRTLLATNGNIESIIDFGQHAFSRAYVPSCVVIWKKCGTGFGQRFPILKITREQWNKVSIDGPEVLRSALKKCNQSCNNRSGNIENPTVSGKSKRIEFPESPHRIRLGEIATLREGSHAICAVPVFAPRTPSGKNIFPVLIDKTMGNLQPPEIGYILEPELQPSVVEHHQDERFLIRKTGDNLVVAPILDDKFALGHQNVYVGKLKTMTVSIPFLALVGILGSDLMTGIYRSGPGGQENRPMAQLRLHFLNQLPIVVIPAEFSRLPEPRVVEVKKLISLARSDEYEKIEPVPCNFQSEHENVRKIAERIRLYHEAISTLVLEIVRGSDNNSRIAMNRIVDKLYDVENRNE
ncbi:MAG: N-6 DNA methylase [bacterium]|nr:N-6 DNA methylase [bacterium]